MRKGIINIGTLIGAGATILVAVAGAWLSQNQKISGTSERIARQETRMEDVDKRLTRIESKIDTLIENQTIKNAKR